MVKAQDLINSQKEREKSKYKIFAKVYSNIEKKISLASGCNFYYVWYEIPEFLIGSPLYNLDECRKAVVLQLKDNGFDVEEFENNILLVKWFPK